MMRASSYWLTLSTSLPGLARMSRGAAPGLGDLHPYRRRVVPIAGIVDLRAVRDHGERIHLRPQCHLAAWQGDALCDRGGAGTLHGHTHKEVHVRHDVAPP